MKTELIKQLKIDEGTRPCVYADHLGYQTIGVGRMVDQRKLGSGLRPDEISYLLNNDIDDRINALGNRLPWFRDLDDVRKGVLLNMAFQLGTDGLMAFKNTLSLIQQGKYYEAADAMMQSKWATQTPARAERLSRQMRNGQWIYGE